MKHFFFLLLTSVFSTFTVFSQVYPGFKVQGRFLYDKCGEKVILRGISNPNIWFEKNGNPRYAEIKKTGANVVRIVWAVNGTASQLDQAISNCIAQQMIPMPELHDATGDLSKVQSCVNYWIRSDVVEVLKKHEKYLLVNIANEPGDGKVTGSQFYNTYSSAVSQMRNAGIHVPLVIDGSDWGKNVNIMQAQGPALINADPDKNLIFSVHMWWPQMYGFSESDIVNEIAESVNMGLPLIVGEFSKMHGSCEEKNITSNNSIAYKTIIRECQKNEVGYIAWSWFGNCNPFWDMSTAGTYATLYDWGLEVAVTDTNSIQNTSVRPYYIANGICNSTGSTIIEAPGNGLLLQNFPNSFQTSTLISYNLSKNSNVRLEIFNSYGVKVKTLIDEFQTSGKKQIMFSGSDLAAGIYICSVVAEDNMESRKLMLVK
jgi:mannan endo-1,4-beta-mannosidase